jgi:toxin ParE1/3/4
VPDFRLTRRTDADLTEIVRYTLDRWGTQQTARYIDQMETLFNLLAANPRMGRACDEVARGVRRSEHGRHVVFYRPRRRGILILRILHQRMVPTTHPFKED